MIKRFVVWILIKILDPCSFCVERQVATVKEWKLCHHHLQLWAQTIIDAMEKRVSEESDALLDNHVKHQHGRG